MLVLSRIPNHEWVGDEEAAKKLLAECMKREFIALDTEGTGLNKVKDRVVDWSLAFEGRRVALSGRLLPIFKPLFTSKEIIKVFHNAKFDMHLLANMGITVGDPVHDTLVMSRLENTERGENTLKYLSGDGLFDKSDERHVDYESPFGGKIKGYQDLVGSIGADKAREYASLDAISLLFVYEELKDRLGKANAWKGSSLWQFYLDEEVPFTRVLWNCERRGICIDMGYLEEKSLEAEEKIKEIEFRFCESAGKVINLSSPMQLREYFFDIKGKKPLDYTSGGASGNRQPSVNAATLKKWAEHGDPDAQLLLEHRKLMKLNGTYLKGLLKLADDNMRIHSNFNQNGTDTGRLSSNEPNLQNIPRPKGDQFKIRGAFVAPPGKFLINADYDQLEMKLLADFSDEPDMINAINDGKDMHCNTAALMYEVPYAAVAEAKRRDDHREQLTSTDVQLLDYRQKSKTIGFGLMYGQGPARLGASLGISQKEAEQLIDRFFKPLPGIKQFIDDVHEYVTDRGLVRTLSGRPRHLRDGVAAKGQDNNMYFRALRQAVNAIIQGSAADIVRKAMVMCENDPELNELGCEQLLQVHDELMFECPEENVERAMKRVQELMEAPYETDLKVKLTAGPNVGFTWLEAK